MDVYEQIQNRLSSLYSLDRYLGNAKWDKLKLELAKLKPASVYYLQVAGRFDIAANAVYGDPMLDWVLMMYNSFKTIGYEEGFEYRKSLTVTLAPGESISEDVPLSYSNVLLIYNDETVSNVSQDTGTGDLLASLDGDGIADLRIKFGSSQASAVIMNVGSFSWTVRIEYTVKEYSDELGVGTAVSFPSIDDIIAAFNKVNAQEDQKTGALVTGFSRL